MKKLSKAALIDTASSGVASIVAGAKSLLPATGKDERIAAGPGFYNKQNAALSADNDPSNSSRVKGTYPVLEYPIGLSDPSSENSGPMMVITGLKYTRRQEGQLMSSKYNGRAKADSVDRSTDIQFIIRLPMPGGVTTDVSNSYKDHEGWGNLIGQLAGGNLGGDADKGMRYLKEIWNNQTQKREGEGYGDVLLRGAGHLMNAASDGMSGSKVIANAVASIGRDEGIALNNNAKVTAQYEGPDVMSHNFAFQMIPTSENESIMIRNIIQLLQEHSTGESKFDSSSLIVDYPSIFNIEFVTNRIVDKTTKDNTGRDVSEVRIDTKKVKGVLDIPDCYITNANIIFNQGPNRLMSDNSPAMYNLTLSMKNTAALTRQNLRTLSALNADGYEELTEDEELNSRSFIEDVLATSRISALKF